MLISKPHEELLKETAWIAGVKFHSEPEFHTQIVRTLARKQRLWQIWQQVPCLFYFQEIYLPVKTPEDYTPF